MPKKKLFSMDEKDQRSFLERLTIAYAPIDELVMRTARETAKKEAAKKDAEKTDTSDHKHGLGVRFAVRHLGSI